jgi:uncharacterized membrane protein YGL010W
MTSLFRPATELLVQYARYHRDPRNILTHFVGIPLIVFSLGVLLGRPTLAVLPTPFGEWALTPAWLLWAWGSAWYFSRGLPSLAAATVAVNTLLFALASPIASASTLGWLGCGIGSFVLGWALQFLGHHYEGRKPAFADDLVGLLVGPEFVVAEALFHLGALAPLQALIEREAGPLRQPGASPSTDPRM